ncbi:MAG: hypothetical protein ABW123_13900 [Cystobacter sp.]
MRTMTLKSRIATISVLASWLATPVLAATECRENKNVTASVKSEKDNRDAGGHVGLHLKDATAPLPKSGDKSQQGKTAFKDWKTFSEAFGKWNKGGIKPTDVTVGPRECGTSGSQKDCIKASALGITEAWTCTEADKKTGICTTWKPVEGTLYVGFWYANSKGTGGKWIMNTAYPSTNAECN